MEKKFNIYDSTGTLLRGGFSTRLEAQNWAWVRGLKNYSINN